MTQDQQFALASRMHEVPHPAINGALSAVLRVENLLGRLIAFPFGTSLLAVLEKPSASAASDHSP